MLKDPRWDKVPSLAGIALYCASKPADEAYDWPNCRECAVGQYLRSIDAWKDLNEWNGDMAVANRLAHGGYQYWDSERKAAWTFGRLYDRILAYQMSGEKTESLPAVV